MLRILVLFVLTALAEILGCHRPCLVLRAQRPTWLLRPAALSLGLFAWLLTLHPTAAGRIDAAYGAVDVSVALAWLRLEEGMPFSLRDLVGSLVLLSGMAIPTGGGSRR